MTVITGRCCFCNNLDWKQPSEKQSRLLHASHPWQCPRIFLSLFWKVLNTALCVPLCPLYTHGTPTSILRAHVTCSPDTVVMLNVQSLLCGVVCWGGAGRGSGPLGSHVTWAVGFSRAENVQSSRWSVAGSLLTLQHSQKAPFKCLCDVTLLVTSFPDVNSHMPQGYD